MDYFLAFQKRLHVLTSVLLEAVEKYTDEKNWIITDLRRVEADRWLLPGNGYDLARQAIDKYNKEITECLRQLLNE